MPSGARSAWGRLIIGSAGTPVFAEYIANAIHECNIKIDLMCLIACRWMANCYRSTGVFDSFNPCFIGFKACLLFGAGLPCVLIVK